MMHEPPPITAYQHLRLHLGVVKLMLKRHVARHWHRLVQSSGQLNDLFVSLQEAQHIIDHPEHDAPLTGPPDAVGWDPLEVIDDALSERLTILRGIESHPAAATLPLLTLRERFGLTDVERWILIVALAPHLSVDLARLYTFARADFTKKQSDVGLLLELVAERHGHTLEWQHAFEPQSRLVRTGLLTLHPPRDWVGPTPLLQSRVSVAPSLITFVHDRTPVLPDGLRVATTVRDTVDVTQELVYANEIVNHVRRSLGQAMSSRQGRPHLMLIGPRGSGRTTLIASLLAGVDAGVLVTDVTLLDPAPLTFRQQLRTLAFEARLRGQLLALRLDAFLDTIEPDDLRLLALAEVVNDLDVPAILTARKRTAYLVRMIDDLREHTFEPLTREQQAYLWQHLVNHAQLPANDDLSQQLSERFSLAPGAIWHAVQDVAHTRRHARQRHPSTDILTDIHDAVRRRLDHSLSALATPFITSQTWDDVVLPDDLLASIQEILAHAEHQDRVMETWGFKRKISYGLGISCLFAGPPGTGKTMVSSLLARSLGRELYRIDLSRIASKWVGETEKNLARVFDEAEQAQVILLFDEADSLFANRTEVKGSNDRYANMEINYLLQRMEAYAGITILTTNFENAIDDAFKRRIRFRLSFPIPDEEQRARLFQTMIPDEADVAPDIDFEELSENFEFAGGNIRNAVLSAAFLAAREHTHIHHVHLEQACLNEAHKIGLLVRGFD